MGVNIHATCIRVARAGRAFGVPAAAGILILGKSGAGKSDLALRLIALGAVLVSDDRTDLAVTRGRLVASAPRTIAGLLEVRGVGIVKVPHATRATVSLVVELTDKVPRLPERETYTPPPPLRLAATSCPRLLRLDPFEASAPQKALIAARP
ncbi:MAG TPA: HPr kinase/phosphatase C-terminal domain-containing protein [Rhizomicrobium sp.]